MAFLYEAVYDNNFEKVKKELAKPNPDINFRDAENKTPLMLAAAMRRDIRIFNALLEAGADVNAVNDFGETVLFSVVRSFGNFGFYLNALIEHGGFDINATNNNGVTALGVAITRIVHPSIAKMLLDAGANPNVYSEYKLPVLIHAALDKHEANVKSLLNAGADPTLAINIPGSPYHGQSAGDMAEARVFTPGINKLILSHISHIKKGLNNKRALQLAIAMRDPETGGLPMYLPQQILAFTGNRGPPGRLTNWQKRQLAKGGYRSSTRGNRKTHSKRKTRSNKGK